MDNMAKADEAHLLHVQDCAMHQMTRRSHGSRDVEFQTAGCLQVP